MGIPTNIKTLLSGNVVEWARIEFKETWDAEASLKTICAFANDIDNWGGGYLVIGVRDKNGKPDSLMGVSSEKVDGYLKDMLNKCKLIQPEYMPITEVTEYQGKTFVVVWAPGGSVRPYASPKTMAKDNREKIYWIRKMASTIAPTEEEKRDLYSLANNVPFDDRINHEANITDLNITLIQSYLKEVGSSLYEDSLSMNFVELCKSMNIVNTLPEYTKPKNVGLMFFSLNPERFRRYRNRRIGEFLKEMHLTEGRNTGFRKILNALEHNGSPKPIFETDSERLSFAVTLFIHHEFKPQNEVINEAINEVINADLSKKELTILNEIEADPECTIQRLAEKTSMSRATVERIVKSLKGKGVVVRTGSRKTGRWIVSL